MLCDADWPCFGSPTCYVMLTPVVCSPNIYPLSATFDRSESVFAETKSHFISNANELIYFRYTFHTQCNANDLKSVEIDKLCTYLK